MRLLVIRFSALGDVAMTVPVVQAFAEEHHDVEICILTRTRFTPLFSNMPENVETIGINLADYKGIVGLYRLYKELKARRFDCVADLHDVLRTKILRFFFRMAKIRVVVVDKGRKEKKALIGHGMDAEAVKPMRDRYLETLMMLEEFKGSRAHPSIGSGTEFEGSSREIKIGIAPFAAYETKMYPLDKMEKVVRMLAEKGYQIYLFGGGEKEKKILSGWESKEVKSMCGKLSGLKEELDFMKGLNLMVAMDSANLHLATMVGTPTVSVWGATHPKAGFAPEKSVIVQKDLECRPCSIYGNAKCKFGDIRCMILIEPEEIVDTVMRLCGQEGIIDK